MAGLEQYHGVLIRFDPTDLRVVRALALSFGLHALVIVPFHWPLNIEPAANQIFLLASLQPAAPVRSPPAEAPRPANPAADHPAKEPKGTRRLAAPRGGPEKLAAQDTEPRKTQNAPQSETREAVILEQAVPPEYPVEALQRRLEGCVLASVTVSPSGEVVDVRILQSDHSGVFDQSVIDSQKAARYFPAQKDGGGVESRVLAVAAFVLDTNRKLNCTLRFAGIAESLIRQRE